MKLPFLLNSVSRASTASEVESVFSKFLRVIRDLEGPQVSNVLNLLSKKDVTQPVSCWNAVARLLLSSAEEDDKKGGSQARRSDRVHLGPGPLEQGKLQDSTDEGSLTGFLEPSRRSSGMKLVKVPRGKNHGTDSVLAKYNIRDAIIVLNAFAKVGTIPPELIRTVTSMLLQDGNRLDSRELSTVIHSLGKHGMTGEISALLGSNPEAFHECKANELDYSMLMRVVLLNRDTFKESSVLEKLGSMFEVNCSSMSDKSMAILVNSLARFGCDENGFMVLLAPLITDRLRAGSFSPMCISQIANGVARLNFKDRGLMSEISRRTCEDLPKFNTRAKVTVLNAFHKLDMFDGRLFSLLAENLASSNQDMTPQCIANTVSAVAHFSLRVPHGQIVVLFTALGQKVAQFKSLQKFNIQNQVNILNGFSKVGIYDERLYVTLGDNIMASVTQVKPIDAACILNAFARARRSHELVVYICENIDNYLIGTKIQELSCCINSINVLRKCCDPDGSRESAWRTSVEKVANHMVGRSEPSSAFRPLDIRLAIVCLADCGIVEPTMYSKLLSHLEANLHRASMWDLVGIFSGLAKVEHVVSVSLLDAIARCLHRIGVCKERWKRDVSSILCSLEALGIQHPVTEKLAQYSPRGGCGNRP